MTMANGATRLYDPRPCEMCGGRVALLASACESCGARVIGPQPGPQDMFLAADAEIVLYGGAAYGGKSYALLLDALRYIDTPGWTGLILRRQSADYSDPSSIFEKAKRLYAGIYSLARSSSGTRDIRFPSGAMLAFRHLGDANLQRYQGTEYAWIGIDEATHFEMQWIRWMLTRMRTNCGSKPRMRLTCNPDPDHAFAKWVEPYLILDKSDPRYGCADREKSGKTRFFATSASGKEEQIWADSAEDCAAAAGRPVSEVKSFAFIAADLQDNPIGLAEDPGYVANLAASGRTNEKRLREGNWLIKDDRGGLIQRGYFGVVDKPLAMIVRRVRAWDLAARAPSKKRPDPDYTIGVRIEWDVFGRWYITDVVACRRETTDVDKLMAAVASSDGPMVVQSLEIEGGASGITAEQHLRRVLRSLGRCGPIYSARPGGDKVEKARPMTNGLSLGMKGNRPRVVAIEYDPDTQPGEVFEPIAYIVDNGWMVQPYEDTGDHPPTVGALFWRQCLAFGTEEEHDDIPDAMAIAHRTPADVVELADPYDPLRRNAALT